MDHPSPESSVPAKTLTPGLNPSCAPLAGGLETPMEQRTPEWFEARRGRVTASKIPQILRSPRQAMIDHIRDCLGMEPRFKGNAATQYGTDTEPEAREWLSKHLGKPISEVGFVTWALDDSLGASPDGIIEEDGTLIEIKCPYSKDIPDVPDPRHVDQVQWQLGVTGKDKAILLYYSPDPMEPGAIFRIKRLDKRWSELKTAAYKHLNEAQVILDGDPRAWLEEAENGPDEREDTAWRIAEARYAYLKERADEIAGKLQEARDTLMRLSDGKDTKGRRVLVQWVSRNSGIDWDRYAKDNDLTPGDDYRKPGTKYAKVTML